MADAHQVTPGSPESGTPGKLPAPKDKRCKFCQAPFTSSSLGRHLDLYIKGKNPKPPDGLHNVDEIRRMRGNVTRRQARTSTSSTKREGSTSSSKPTPLRDERSPSIIRYYTDGERPEKGSVMMRLNEANWQVTGVINNLPPPSSAEVAPRYMKRRDSSRRMSLKNDLGSRHDALEERDRGRAAELALKEVLGSIRAANLRAHPPSPFEFDFLSLTFPVMCLKCLSSPPSLFSSQFIPNPNSWSVDTPGPPQFDSLHRWLQKKLRDWRQQRASLGLPKQPNPNGMNGHANQQQQQNPDREGDEKDALYNKHLVDAFQAWKALSDGQKHDTWHLETLRALAREQELHKQTATRLDQADQTLHHLRAQLHLRANCQQPPKFSTHPLDTLPLSHETARIANATPTEDNELLSWDFDRLLWKWKSRLQSDRAATQQALPSTAPTPPNWHLSPTALNPPPRLNGTSSSFSPQQQRDHHSQSTHEPSIDNKRNGDVEVDVEDEDLADAPCDEDELGDGANGVVAAVGGVMERGMLDPDLRGEEGVKGLGMRGGGQEEEEEEEEGGEGFVVGGRMLMGLREYTDGV
ncbi:hypothetical protein MMC12_000629 [Toensbergia leucococca]|nr:hypothetical protein [Toensbergia leucococca]